MSGASAVAFGYWALVIISGVVAALFVAFSWRRSARYLLLPNYEWSLPPNMLLMALPTGLSVSAIGMFVGIPVAALAAASGFLIRPHQGGRLQLPIASFALLGAALVVVLRPNYPGTVLNVAFFSLGAVALMRAVYLSTSKSDAVTAFLDGVGIYLIASVVLWAAGLSNVGDRTAGLENSITHGQRVIFPLSTSLAATPAVAAGFVVAIIPVLIVSRRLRVLRFASLAAAVVVFVLSDTRASLLGAVILCGLILVWPAFFRVIAPWVIAAALLTPFVYGLIQDALARGVIRAASYVPWLIRPDEQVGTLNQRDYIWSQARWFFVDRVDLTHQVFGYGSFGHAESGASAYYYGRLGGLTGDDRLLTPHNSMLQLLFDGGWVVAAAFALIILYMALKLARRRSPFALASLAMLTALVIGSITEVTLSPGHAHAQPTWWMLLFLGIVTFAREETADSSSSLPVRVLSGNQAKEKRRVVVL
jgi:hypothetical protein